MNVLRFGREWNRPADQRDQCRHPERSGGIPLEVPFKLAQRDPSTFARDDDESSTPRYDSLWPRYLRRLS